MHKAYLRSKTNQNPSELTPALIGVPDLGLMVKTWNNLAISECRIGLMEQLLSRDVGFRDVDAFSRDIVDI